MKKLLKSKKGITLIALVVTIVVLIILASISIGVLGGEDGLINQAKLAKEETEISEEKELLGRATVQVAGKDVYGNIEEEALQKELDKEAGEGKTDVTDIGEEFEVIFKEKNRYYIVDKDGNIGDAQEIIEDKNPGDITKDKDGNELDGSEEYPYEIWCIEDLVEWSKNYNTYLNYKIILCRDLNFKSKLSYNNSERTDYGDINGNEDDGNTLINEMTTGLGFYPISTFGGNFDGQGHELKNLYMRNGNDKGSKNLGLFASLESGAIIKNISVNVDIKSDVNLGKNATGGIVGLIANKSNIELSNNSCTGKIISQNNSGGMIGENYYTKEEEGNIKISNCINNSNITTRNYCGGIVGIGAKIEIKNCYNTGNMQIIYTEGAYEGDTAYVSTGGIIGVAGKNSYIYNCYNTGNITNDNNKVYCGAGGIVGNVGASGEYVKIINCYNIGKTSAKYLSITQFSGGILGGFWYGEYNTNIKNCFYDQTTSDRSVGGSKEEYAQALTREQIQNKELIQNENGTSNKLIELLNNYIENNSDEIETSTWKKWKLEENGYPVFEE